MVDMKRKLGNGVLGQAPMQQQMQQQMPQQQPEQKKRGVGGAIADFIINYGAASGNPLAGGIIQNRMREQQQKAAQQAQERLYNRKRADGREDQQWAWDNKPKDPDPLTRDMIAAGIDPKSPQGVAMYKKSAEKRTADYILVPDGRGGVISVQRPGMSPPKVYGTELPPGFQIEGGPASAAPGNFRP